MNPIRSESMKATSPKIKASAETMLSERHPTLSAMFTPKSVAEIGAGEKPGAVGYAIDRKSEVVAHDPNNKGLLVILASLRSYGSR